MPGTAALINLHGYTPDQMAAGFEGVVLNFPRSGRRGRFDRRPRRPSRRPTRRRWRSSTRSGSEAAPLRPDRLGARRPTARARCRTSRRWPPSSRSCVASARCSSRPTPRRDIEKAAEVAEGQGRPRDPAHGRRRGLARGRPDRRGRAPRHHRPGPRPPDARLRPLRPDVPERGAARTRRASPSRSGRWTACRTTATSRSTRASPWPTAEDVGFDRQDALEAVTINPPASSGWRPIGSIEVGKDATLFVADGDPFEPATEVRTCSSRASGSRSSAARSASTRSTSTAAPASRCLASRLDSLLTTGASGDRAPPSASAATAYGFPPRFSAPGRDRRAWLGPRQRPERIPLRAFHGQGRSDGGHERPLSVIERERWTGSSQSPPAPPIGDRGACTTPDAWEDIFYGSVIRTGASTRFIGIPPSLGP